MGKAELNIDSTLLTQALEAGVAVDAVIDEALRAAIRKRDPEGAEARAAKWVEENAEAIAHYNRRVHGRGVFSDGLRTW
ncbi:MAG: type II toxin-antitoxin system CcdA family antitoxin [Phenylobacterium sp.]|jgi:antitoxin CcdA